MELLLQRDVPCLEWTLEARLSHAGPLIALVVIGPAISAVGVLLALMALNASGIATLVLAAIAAVPLLAGGFSVRSALSALRHGAGRVLAAAPEGVLVDLRHRGNRHFPDDAPSVVFFAPGDIARIEEVVVRVQALRDPESSTRTTEATGFLDLCLSTPDDGTLARALRYERVRMPPGFIASRMKASLIALVEPDRLRIAWSSTSLRVLPDLAAAADTLRATLRLGADAGGRFTLDASGARETAAVHAAAGDRLQAARILAVDAGLTTSQAGLEARALESALDGRASASEGRGQDPYGRDPERVAELERRLREHARAGHSMRAYRIARELHPELPLREARALVERLRSDHG